MSVNWIPLLVPEQDYVELAELVAKRVSSREVADSDLTVQSDLSSVPPAGDPAEAALRKHEPWDVAELRRLASSDIVTAQRWARAIDVCAGHVGQFLSTQQVAAESGMSINEWRDAPRKITRHLASHYPAVNGTWPLVVVSGKQLGHSYDQAYWAITEEQAKRWAEARTAIQ